MKNQFYATLLSLLMLAAVCPVCAQQGGIGIYGKITSLEDGLPLRAASVSVARKGVGTSTNAAGQFVLLIPAANLNDTLKISHIGFKTQLIAISGLKNEQNLAISLEKNTTQLKEVNIAYYNADKIIQKALNRIPDNYIDHPHVIRGFYRMYTYNKVNPLELSEAVFDVYNFGYSDKRADLFRLIKARSAKNERDFSTLELGQKPNSVFEADVVNHIRASGFLNEDGLKNHIFHAVGIVDVKGYQAYQIDFEEKPNLNDRSYRGSMYIDVKTYAFIYFDFGLSPSGLEDLGFGSFAKHAMMNNGNVPMELVHDHSKVSYQQVGNKWVLSDVEGDDELHVSSADLNADTVVQVQFNYQVTAVDTAQTASFSTKMGRNENINDHDSDEGESFWKTYNILLSDYDAEAIFKQLRAINKANKEKK